MTLLTEDLYRAAHDTPLCPHGLSWCTRSLGDHFGGLSCLGEAVDLPPVLDGWASRLVTADGEEGYLVQIVVEDQLDRAGMLALADDLAAAATRIRDLVAAVDAEPPVQRLETPPAVAVPLIGILEAWWAGKEAEQAQKGVSRS